MRREELKQMRAVTGRSPEEFAENFNRAQRELAGKRTETIYAFDQGHVAYLTYTETTEVAETIKDEFEMRGEVHTCAECPYLDRNFDGRVKWHNCKMGRTTLDNTGCEYLYQQIQKGEVDP